MQISQKIKFFAFWSSNNWEMHLFDHFTTPTTIVVVLFFEKVNILFVKEQKAGCNYLLWKIQLTMKNHWIVKNELLKMINFEEVNQSSGYMHKNVHCALLLKMVGRSQFLCIKNIFQISLS